MEDIFIGYNRFVQKKTKKSKIAATDATITYKKPGACSVQIERWDNFVHKKVARLCFNLPEESEKLMLLP